MGTFDMKNTYPFLPAPLLVDSYFNPIYFPSVFPLKYLPEKVWLTCLRPSVSFAPTPSQFPVYITYWSSLWCVVHRLSFERQWHGDDEKNHLSGPSIPWTFYISMHLSGIKEGIFGWFLTSNFWPLPSPGEAHETRRW